MTDGPSILDFVTFGIAAVGAVTGIAALSATWAQFALSGPRLKVTASTAIGGDAEGHFFLGVGIQNRGRTAATVTGASLRLRDGNQHVPLGMMKYQGYVAGPDWPVRLEPYAEQTWLVRVDALARELATDGRRTAVTPFVRFHGKTSPPRSRSTSR